MVSTNHQLPKTEGTDAARARRTVVLADAVRDGEPSRGLSGDGLPVGDPIISASLEDLEVVVLVSF